MKRRLDRTSQVQVLYNETEANQSLDDDVVPVHPRRDVYMERAGILRVQSGRLRRQKMVDSCVVP